MISYTTSAEYSAGTTFKNTNSGSWSQAGTFYDGENETDVTFSGYGSGQGFYQVFADGSQIASGSGNGARATTYNSYFNYVIGGNNANEFGATTSPDGGYKRTESRSDYYFTNGEMSGTGSWLRTEEKGFTSSSFSYQELVSNGDLVEDPINESGSETWAAGSQQIQTTTTLSFERSGISTSATTFYNRIGTTTTAGTNTIPTTSSKSWTEIRITYSTKTKNAIVTTTSSENAHGSLKTAHTIFILGAGEVFYTLKAHPNIATPVTGTENWNSFAGPTTITVSRWPCATHQCPVLDATEQIYNTDASATSSTKTVTQMQGVETANVTAFYKTTEGLPLGSYSFKGAGSKIKTSSVTYVNVSNPPPTAGTSERAGTTQTVTHNVNIGGVAFPVNGKAETTNITVAVPVVRSATFTGERRGDPQEDEDGNEIEGPVIGHEVGALAEEGNFFVSYGAVDFPNGGGISDAYLRRASAWATVGDGTTATAVPKQSWTINGVSKVTWTSVSVSDGVASPWPSSGVETTTITQASAGTTSTTTATTAIWGNVYRRTTSTSNSSGVTTSEKTTQLNAGGNGHTMLQLGGLPSLPTPSYIPSPVGSVLPVFGAAHVSDKRTVIVLPAQYANTTVDNPITYSGSTLPETYFETQGNLEIALEGQGGSVSRLQSLW
jgi:hypothetical protein